ncbi:hypothetical protein BHE74_00044622 [Ensete ventricosum]|nr:hypothetical protein BHE74_00044622 [Ensete ventricosum]
MIKRHPLPFFLSTLLLVSKPTGQRPFAGGRRRSAAPGPVLSIGRGSGGQGAVIPLSALLVHKYLPAPALLAAEGSIPSAYSKKVLPWVEEEGEAAEKGEEFLRREVLLTIRVYFGKAFWVSKRTLKPAIYYNWYDGFPSLLSLVVVASSGVLKGRRLGLLHRRNTGRWNAGFYEDLGRGRCFVVKCELLQRLYTLR